MDENIVVFFGEKNILVPKGINFKQLRIKILQTEKRLIKYFIFGGKKINENLSIKNYPTFQIVFDKSLFNEYKKNQFRCKKCRKYLKFNNLTCRHSNICKTYYNFTKKESFNEIIDGGCFEKVNDNAQDSENISRIEEESFSDISEEIKRIIDKRENIHKKIMMNKINEILSRGLNE